MISTICEKNMFFFLTYIFTLIALKSCKNKNKPGDSKWSFYPLPLDPKTMKNEGFTPQIMGYKVITTKNEGCGFPW